MPRILITTDGSENALRAIAYVAQLYQGASDLEVTLLHLYPALPQLFLEEPHDPQIRKQLQAWKKRREGEAQKYIKEASQILKRAGIKGEQIQAKHGEQVVGVARDIVREADAGRYDALVLGKKGLSRIEEFFLGSITNKLMELAVGHPLWIVEGKVTSRKVLIAMDETDHAALLARYAGRMLAGLKGVEIELYHCCAPFPEPLSKEESKAIQEIGHRYVERKRERMGHFFDEARNALVDAGIDGEAIRATFHFEEALVSPGKGKAIRKVSRILLEEVKNGEFGTLVMGRKGKTMAREYRMGSTTLFTIGDSRDCAVWVV